MLDDRRDIPAIGAQLGVLEIAEPSFEIADDIPNGGVLCGLPALLAFGLLRHSGSHFTLPKGFWLREFRHRAPHGHRPPHARVDTLKPSPAARERGDRSRHQPLARGLDPRGAVGGSLPRHRSAAFTPSPRPSPP